MKIIILHDFVSGHATPDERDTLIEAKSFQKILKELGHKSSLQQIDNDLNRLEKRLLNIEPDLVINLVESFNGSGQLSYRIPALLERLHIPFTGENSKTIRITTDKLSTKKKLTDNDILTPVVIFPPDKEITINKGLYIIKPNFEDASIGIDDSSIVEISNQADLNNIVKDRKFISDSKYFIEEYIPGREWNVSIIQNILKPQILPPAEIIFKDYPAEKPKFLNYGAKWDETSFVYKNTIRTFNHDSEDLELITKIKNIALKCWGIFEMKSYARIDYRVNNSGIPYVLEINANPCISPDAGLAAAADAAGIGYKSLINKIIRNALL